jgi:hypothetical protein
MALRFIGKDPDSPNGDSPSVWDDGDSYVIQGWRSPVRTRSPNSCTRQDRARYPDTRHSSGSQEALALFHRGWLMSGPAADELLRSCERSAVHLETRDCYSRTDPLFIRWQAGHRDDPADRGS